MEYCRRRGTPLPLGCDVNAHCTVCESTNNNLLGEHLLEFILETNLSIFNVGNTPTFVTRARQGVLDITCGSPCLIDRIGNSRVSKELSLSNRPIISFEVTGIQTMPSFRINPRHTYWDEFDTNLERNLERMTKGILSQYELEQ